MPIHHFKVSAEPGENGELSGYQIDVRYLDRRSLPIDLNALVTWSSMIARGVVSGEWTPCGLVADGIGIRITDTQGKAVCDTL